MYLPYGKAIATWLSMLVAIVALGAARQALLEPAVGELRAHQLGTLAACAVVLALSAVFVRWAAVDAGGALRVGAFWLALCLLFEFGFFHFARGVPWALLLRDYDVLRGRLLPLLWATVLAGPWVVARLLAR
jgi:hypothetical protein